jgi:hypothetical protein
MPSELERLRMLLREMARLARDAQRAGLLRRYWTDLLIDLENVADPVQGAAPFLWGLRECGTLFVPLPETGREYRAALDSVRYWAAYGEPRVFYLWDGQAFHGVAPEDLVETYAQLVAQHVSEVLA